MNSVTIRVFAADFKSPEKACKKLQKVVKKLRKGGWITEDDTTFWHPAVLNKIDARLNLWELGLLTTVKARIWIEEASCRSATSA